MSVKRNKGGFLSKVRNTILLIILVAVTFLSGLFGNIFPGLDNFKDGLFEKLGNNEIVQTVSDTQQIITMPVLNSEILITGDQIFYMEKEVTLEELSMMLDEQNPQFITVIDDKATQRTWIDVGNVLQQKNISMKEQIK